MKRIVLLLLVLVVLLSAAACSDDKKDGDSVEPTQAAASQVDPAQEEPEDEETPTYVIQAGGLNLKYPEKWKDKVEVTVTDESASFACGDVKLFELLFSAREGSYVLGTVIGEKNVVISLVDYELNSDDPELLEMQMGVNVILQNLMKDYEFVADEAVDDNADATFDIETSVVTMKYPLRWKDRVTVDVTDEGVSFSDGDTALFDLVFSEGEDSFLLGTYNGTPISIVEYDIETDDQIAMQADVNVILSYLMEDANFVINQ